MRRAQVIGQVFIFILAALIFVLILGYGYRAVSTFLARGEEVQAADFRNELESAINTIKRDYGSVRRVDLKVPGRANEVCLVTYDYRDVITSGWQEKFRQEKPLLYSAWETGSYNVFLVPLEQTPIPIRDIIVDPAGKGYLCIASAGARVSLRVEGTGSKAIISEWPVQEGK
ncbi:MAG: hypothetical protein QXM31_02960 [Candidatus Woesearchaeota archaeon]